ncbi:ATP-binding protein [Streptomyces sp. NPDC059928]|uniref:ATP-binding protein n=1 Tax=unclassified Streptomyces TaxID=2593676 RepID=UPI003664388C
MNADAQEYRQELVVHAENLSSIRRSLRDQLRDWGLGLIAYDVEVCTNELLTNVHDHAGTDDCEMTLSRRRNRIRVVVSDNSGALPEIKECTDAAEDGRGLSLVASLSSDWGASPRAHGGKDVWFEFRLDEGELAA